MTPKREKGVERLPEDGIYTASARKLFLVATKEASRLGHAYLGTEHFLLAGVREQEDYSLQDCFAGVSVDRVRSAVEFIIGRGYLPDAPKILTPRAKRAIESAVTHKRQFGDEQISVEHILLGVLGDRDCIACASLETLNLNLDKLTEKLTQKLNHSKTQDQPGLTQE